MILRLKGQPGQVRCCNRDGALYRAICEGGVRRSWSCAIILSPHNHAAGCRRRSCTRLSFGSGAIRLYTRETTPVYTVCMTCTHVEQCSAKFHACSGALYHSFYPLDPVTGWLAKRNIGRCTQRCGVGYDGHNCGHVGSGVRAALSLRSALDATSKDSERE